MTSLLGSGSREMPLGTKGGKINFLPSIVSPKALLSEGLQGLSDLPGTANDWSTVRIMALPVTWVGAQVSLGRDRRQFVMCKFNRQ